MEALEPEPLKFIPGQSFGNYRLLRLVGSGAFADIYLGEHYYLRTRAAVKIARRQIPRTERFLKEARIAARLVHPRIVRILDFGIEQGVPYLVMDYAARGSLRQRHPIGERLERDEILEYAWDIAEALEYIHGQNYIHRDLKPENLLIGREGQILVSDFGIAIAVQETWGIQEQESVGTLPYMAPEQIMGRPCLASDQYALGVIIYEWISGELPFDENASDLAWQHLHARPRSLRTWLPDLPQAVERVVLKALAKDPGKRFRSVVEFVNQLADAWATPSEPVRRGSFYAKTTYNTETPLEIPALQRLGRPVITEKRDLQIWNKKKTWRIATSSFVLALLLSLVMFIWVPGPSWSPLNIGVSLLIAGLPLCIGLLRKDQRTLALAIPLLCLQLAGTLALQTPWAFLWISLIGTTFCATMAFTLYLRFF